MGSALVIGAGPNGLAAAITLAERGHDVTVLEARDSVGGRTELLADTRTVQPWAVEELGLDVEWTDSPEWRRADAEGVHDSSADLPEVQAWLGEVDRFAGTIRGLCASAPPDIRTDGSLTALVTPALQLMKLGRAGGLELARIGPLCAEDWLDEWDIPRDIQAAIIAPALVGTWMGPRSPTSALALLFYTALSGQSIEGGMPALQRALVKRANGAGVAIQTGQRVQSVSIEDGRATGVELADGTELTADVVLSTVGPRQTLLSLVPARALPVGAERMVENVRTRGIVAVLRASVTAPVFGGADRVVLTADTESLERAFDDAKHRRASRVPALLVHQSAGDLLVHIFGVAHDLDGGWTDSAVAGLEKTVLECLAPHMGAESMTEMELCTPADLEAQYGLEGGHLFHGEFALDQFLSFRPHPSLSGYQSSIDGLFLGGAGMHPAGGFTLGQGILAARRV
jgi:phytoene dehydrogenase-like protein